MEYIIIRPELPDGDYNFCDKDKLPWYHRWHVKPRIKLAKFLVRSCMGYAAPLHIKTFSQGEDNITLHMKVNQK